MPGAILGILSHTHLGETGSSKGWRSYTMRRFGHRNFNGCGAGSPDWGCSLGTEHQMEEERYLGRELFGSWVSFRSATGSTSRNCDCCSAVAFHVSTCRWAEGCAAGNIQASDTPKVSVHWLESCRCVLVGVSILRRAPPTKKRVFFYHEERIP